jgi:hypothetical protein
MLMALTLRHPASQSCTRAIRQWCKQKQWRQATTRMAAIAWLPYAHNSRTASNDSNKRTAYTILVPAKAGMLAKVAKPSCRKANYRSETVNIRISEMTAAAGTIRKSWVSPAAGPPKSDSRKVSNSKDANNNSRGIPTNMDANNSWIFMEIHKKSPQQQKTRKERHKKSKKSPFLVW